ncbi:MAG: gamma carbonic anhydrase family protein [Candidatus Ranarchaeia archaeon]|jgi:carbonic anhydrase/acetyltransferase-like protein (isoleucine patch superfamily)
MPILGFGKKIPQIHATAYVSPDAFILGDVFLGENVNIWPGCIIRGDFAKVQIGNNASIQDGTILHARKKGSPLILGGNVIVGSNSVLSSCYVGDNTLIGASVVVYDGATIGDSCIVTPGSTILENQVTSPRSVVSGIPAAKVREIKKLEEDKHIEKVEIIAEVFNKLHKYLPQTLTKV